MKGMQWYAPFLFLVIILVHLLLTIEVPVRHDVRATAAEVTKYLMISFGLISSRLGWRVYIGIHSFRIYIYIYVCVCLCVCDYMHMYMYMYIYIYIFICIRMHTHIYIYMYSVLNCLCEFLIYIQFLHRIFHDSFSYVHCWNMFKLLVLTNHKSPWTIASPTAQAIIVSMNHQFPMPQELRPNNQGLKY